MYNKILVCLDGSALAEQILVHAKELALRFKSKVVLIQVINVPTIQAISASIIAPAAYPIMPEPEDIHVIERNIKSYLENMAVPLRKEGLDVECAVMEGVPASKIIHYSVDNAIDLIVIATHGRKGLERTFLGSVADEIIRKSRLPILVMRPNEERG